MHYDSLQSFRVSLKSWSKSCSFCWKALCDQVSKSLYSRWKKRRNPVFEICLSKWWYTFMWLSGACRDYSAAKDAYAHIQNKTPKRRSSYMACLVQVQCLPPCIHASDFIRYWQKWRNKLVLISVSPLWAYEGAFAGGRAKCTWGAVWFAQWVACSQLPWSLCWSNKGAGKAVWLRRSMSPNWWRMPNHAGRMLGLISLTYWIAIIYIICQSQRSM